MLVENLQLKRKLSRSLMELVLQEKNLQVLQPRLVLSTEARRQDKRLLPRRLKSKLPREVKKAKLKVKTKNSQLTQLQEM